MKTRRISIAGPVPRKAHPADAAFDLKARYGSLIEPRGMSIIACDFLIDIPEGMVGLICSRSGMASNHGVFVLNAPGVVDPGYHGEVCVLLANFSDRPYAVAAEHRVAQLLILKAPPVELVSNYNAFDHMQSIATSERGIEGFGSTGV